MTTTSSDRRRLVRSLADTIADRHVSQATVEKAADLIRAGRVRRTSRHMYEVSSPSGTTYRVGVVSPHRGVCTCPAGQHDRWCSHLVAAIAVDLTADASAAAQETRAAAAVRDGNARPDTEDDSRCPICGGVDDAVPDDGVCGDPDCRAEYDLGRNGDDLYDMFEDERMGL